MNAAGISSGPLDVLAGYIGRELNFFWSGSKLSGTLWAEGWNRCTSVRGLRGAALATEPTEAAETP